MLVQQDADCTAGSTHTSSHCKALEDLADYIFRAKDPASRVQYASVIKLCASPHGTKPALKQAGIAMVEMPRKQFSVKQLGHNSRDVYPKPAAAGIC